MENTKKTPSEQFLYNNYTKNNNWIHYPPSERTAAIIMQDYANDQTTQLREENERLMEFVKQVKQVAFGDGSAQERMLDIKVLFTSKDGSEQLLKETDQSEELRDTTIYIPKH